MATKKQVWSGYKVFVDSEGIETATKVQARAVHHAARLFAERRSAEQSADAMQWSIIVISPVGYLERVVVQTERVIRSKVLYVQRAKKETVK